MDSTRDYIEAMAEAARHHQREIVGMASATEGERNRRANLNRMAAMLNRPAPMTVCDAPLAWNACASPEWWAAQARWQVGARAAA